MSRPIDLGPDPTVLGEHYCGGPLKQHADQGAIANVPGQAHHARSRPFARGLLKPCHFDFAEEHGLLWLLDRTYPEGVQA